jgi:succinate-semialdehyde dehydrogenase / glutarate-semialdehyde dehydrogenase
MTIISVNPATGERLAEYPQHTAAEIDAMLERVAAAQRRWSGIDIETRARCLRSLAAVLREQARELAALMALEMGKPLPQGTAEIEKCAWVCEYYADNGGRLLDSIDVSSDARASKVVFRPLGVVLAVMPWNFPFWQVFRVAAPTLVAGNAIVLRHASNVPGCAKAIERLVGESDLPADVFRTMFADRDRVAGVVGDARVSAVSVTGSPGAGSSIASTAGAAIKKTVLELGGSDPYLVLADADIEAAAESCVKSRLINSGQSCIAAKRFVVVDSVLDDFAAAMTEKMRAKVAGDPLQHDVDLGPLAGARQRDRLHAQVAKSIDGGAVCLTGGAVPEGRGAFYPPTVLKNVCRGMPVYDEETFGPVAAVIAAADAEDAIRIANDSVYGLGAAVFTADVAFGEAVAATRIESGFVCVNTFVQSDPRLPFGGVKRSGYGRELGSFGIKEFVNTKVVYVGG